MRTFGFACFGLASMLVGCSGKQGDETGNEGEVPTVDPAMACVPDDAAGTTWNDTDHSIPVVALATYTLGELNGRATRYSIPAHPTGVVLYFEGTTVHVAGDGTKEIAGLQVTYLLNELVQAGFAVIDTEADPGSDGADWDTRNDTRDTNDDIDHYLSFWESLIGTTPLTKETPALLLSFSGGGGFLNLFAPAARSAGFDIRGADIHDAGTSGWDPSKNSFPTIWTTMSNEWVDNDVVDEDGGGPAFDSYQAHVAAGQQGLYIPTPEVPFTPQRMMLNPAYDAADAAAAFDDLVNLGILDGDGNRLFDITQYLGMEKFWKEQASVEGPDRVTPELEVAWALHRFDGIHAIEECNFLIPAFE
jgi:hypothetical protein